MQCYSKKKLTGVTVYLQIIGIRINSHRILVRSALYDMYVCMYMYVYMYVWTYTCMYVCLHVSSREILINIPDIWKHGKFHKIKNDL